MKISAVIITFNEEKNIARCLNSLSGVADEILVVDSFSTDKTEAICRERGVRFETNKFVGHIEQKNFAMHHAKYDWILSLDADEALSSDLKESVSKVKSSDEKHAYQLNRLTSYCGKWIKHGGWYPDRKIRLWNRNYGQWGGENPHDRVELVANSKIGFLKGDLLHYSFYSIEEHVAQIQKFTTIAALSAQRNGKRTNWMKIILGPVFTFLKMYFFRLGLLDGFYGLVIAVNSSFYKFLKETKMKSLQDQKT